MIKSWRIRWVGQLAWMREKRKVYRLLVRNPERKRPLRRPRCRWMNNIRMDLREDGVVWTILAWSRTETNGELLRMG
jgi:hypothetical protein